MSHASHPTHNSHSSHNSHTPSIARKALAWLALSLAFSRSSTHAETNSSAPPQAQRTSVNIPLEFNGERLVIPAQINGTNSVWLMLDTGFSISLIDPRLADLSSLVDKGELTLRVAGTYPLESAAEAQRRLDAGGVRGRLVLVP